MLLPKRTLYRGTYYTRSQSDDAPIPNGKLHILDDTEMKTACGKELNGRWMIDKQCTLDEITCESCRSQIPKEEVSVMSMDEQIANVKNVAEDIVKDSLNEVNLDIPTLPKNFHRTRRQFEADKRLYFAKKDRDSREVQGVYYLLLKQFQKFIENEIIDQEDKLINEVLTDEKPILYMDTHKKKISFDPEANWLYIDDMDSFDFAEVVKESLSE